MMDTASFSTQDVAGCTASASRSTVVVAEPTYPNEEHATVNGLYLQAIQEVCGPLVFAATPVQRAAVVEADRAAPAVPWEPMAVLPSGGVHLRRMRAQWVSLHSLVRRQHAQNLILLSAGPETLFVARGLVARHRSLRVFLVMHGNMADVIGWRSRDPRRRLIDLRAGLAVSRHPRIRLVVLEEHIKTAAERLLPKHDFLVWPVPAPQFERGALVTWHAPAKLRLTFVGTANRGKGFDDYLALHRTAGPAFEWAVAGRLGEGFRPEDVPGIPYFDGHRPRADFLAEVQRADYAVLAFRATYELTASASLFDCVTQRKPILAVANPMLLRLADQYGPIGYLCPDLAALQALLASPDMLQDEAAYAGFQRSLDRVHQSRTFEQLVQIVRRDLG